MGKEIVVTSLPMVGGDGPFSYSKNSQMQRRTSNLLKDRIEKLIMEKLDVETLISRSNNTICVADLGCATGPNTFLHVENIIKSIKSNLESRSDKYPSPEFLVFFNDLPSNDFNTLFTALPQDRSYFAVGVPGSFYSRLLPESTVHVAVALASTHWLSRVPEELLDKNSKAWNKGRIHYSSAPEEVVKAYEDQFGRDMEEFLEARAKEIVPGGLVVVGMCGIPRGIPFSNLAAGIMYETMADVLHDMRSEGLVTEDQIDTFNLPIYHASPEEVRDSVEKNGSFTIEIMELMDPSAWLKWRMNSEDVREWTRCIRATMGTFFITQFGEYVTEEILERLTTRLIDVTDKLEDSYREKIMLFFALKRK
ncbi:PREDICTED: probable S-adenosylmethionine-dependent methyltransferase At5g38780 [Tarenaya hassleriana]|uniref:probable S-adenosylmethionine-dependent methyltransferase At5g38780 n=1 Tax=Tarenaya hassleriana TaxID=28532 RepID=UPI00053CA291|nr:PREDICTED: probable S-adenosylmethionine-dependent methyltransferase At5g38780 [Tarenaya hassleriana]